MKPQTLGPATSSFLNPMPLSPIASLEAEGRSPKPETARERGGFRGPRSTLWSLETVFRSLNYKI